MLNHHGGEIILHTKYNRQRSGLALADLADIKLKVQSALKNSVQIEPKPVLYFSEKPAERGVFLVIHVSESATIHTCAGVCFDRRSAANEEVKSNIHQWQLIDRKKGYFPDTWIIPKLSYDHFDFDVFAKAMNLISKVRASHPWLRLSFDEVLKSAGLWRKDPERDISGYTMGALLLFGTNAAIANFIPWFRVDAIFEKTGTMYYDRVVVSKNLIDTFFEILDFVSKHLPDVSHLVGKERVAVRDQIFREAIANMLIHQDYGSQVVAMFLIHTDKSVTLQNASKAAHSATIDPNNYNPKPKNPTIGRFFREMGIAEELGFGLRKILKNMPYYSKGQPEFMDGRMFTTRIPKPIEQILDESDLDLALDEAATYKSDAVSDLNFEVRLGSKINKVSTETKLASNTIETHSQASLDSLDQLKLDIDLEKAGEVLEPEYFALENLNEVRRVRAELILKKLLVSQKLSTQNIINDFGVSRETVAREMRYLKDQNLVSFEGAFKNGSYKLTELGILIAKRLS